MRAVVVALGVVLAVTGVACELVTGSTDGYKVAPSGAEGGTCEGGECSTSFGTCLSAADCGDGGQVCCLEISSSLMSVGETCAARPCTGSLGFGVQLCKSNAECGDAGACTMQTCMLGSGGAATTIQACGLVETCTASN